MQSFQAVPPKTTLALLGLWLALGLVSLVVFTDAALVLSPPASIALWLVALLAGVQLGWGRHYRKLIERAHAGWFARWVTLALTPVLFACLSWANLYVMASWVHSALGHEERIEWTVRGVSQNSPHRMGWTHCPYVVRFAEAGAYLGSRRCVSKAEFDAIEPGDRMVVTAWRSVVGVRLISGY